MARRRGWMGAVALAGLVLAPAPVRGAAPAADGIALVGIVLLDPGRSFAVIEDPGAPRARFYRVGQAFGAGRVMEILADRIVIVVADRAVQLRLATPTGPSLPAADRASTPSLSAPAPDASSPRAALPPGVAVALRRRAKDPKAAPRYGQVVDVAMGRAVSAPVEGDAVAAGQSSAVSTTGSGTPSAQLRVSGLLHDASVQTGSTFSADALRDLMIGVDYTNLTGTHTQRIELYGPDGALYQRFSGSTGSASETRVPVGGTWITEYTLYGNWAVRVYLDNATTPIASGAFLLSR